MGLKELVLGSLTWAIILILLSLPLTLLFIWKVSVVLVAKCIRRDLLLPKALDIMNAPGSGHKYSIVNFGLVGRFEGQVEVEDVRKLFTQKFLGNEGGSSNKKEYERFHYSLVTFGGFAFFKKISQIDINDKILVKNLDDKEGKILEDLLSEWILEKYKENSPCWEIIIIPMRATNQTAFAIKMHHAIADGYSLLYILDQLTDNTSPYLVKDFDDTFGQRVSQMLQVPCHMDKFKGDPQSNPFACKKVDPYQWSISFTLLDLDMLKRVRREHNVHFSSIILSLLGGCLRRYLLEDLHKTPSDLPSHLCMGTTLPWPRHPSKNPETPTNQRICNHWVTALVKVPIGDETPIERLLQVEQALLEFQNQGLHKFMKLVMIPLMWLFPVSFLRSMFATDAGFGGGYSSTLGGNEYKLLGKPITQINQILAIHDANPFIPISTFSFTHSDRYELTFAANPQHFPDRSSLEKVSKEYMPAELKKLATDSFNS